MNSINKLTRLSLKHTISEYKRLEDNISLNKEISSVNLPTLTRDSVALFIMIFMLNLYSKASLGHYETTEDNNVTIFTFTPQNSNQQIYCAFGESDCDKNKAIEYISNLISQNNSDVGLFICIKEWYLIKDGKIVNKIDFNENISPEQFQPFALWA